MAGDDPVALAPWPRNERSPWWARRRPVCGQCRGLGLGEGASVPRRCWPTWSATCEGTGSNVFVVVDGRAMTPPVEPGCLAGITANSCGVGARCSRSRFPRTCWTPVTRCFITSSTRDVHPVTRVGTRDLPVGPVTRGLGDVFDKRSREDVNPDHSRERHRSRDRVTFQYGSVSPGRHPELRADRPSVQVDGPVMGPAQQHQVVDIRTPAVGPGADMVGLALSGRAWQSRQPLRPGAPATAIGAVLANRTGSPQSQGRSQCRSPRADPILRSVVRHRRAPR